MVASAHIGAHFVYRHLPPQRVLYTPFLCFHFFDFVFGVILMVLLAMAEHGSRLRPFFLWLSAFIFLAHVFNVDPSALVHA
jgi:hypothetical protein